MKPRWRVRLSSLAATLTLLVLAGGRANVAAAQTLDPAATVGAYAAALNTHDLEAGLALFDQYGSATDELGHNFEGRQGLSAFLLQSGFGSADARVTTQYLRVLGNRAMWTYTCSCSDGPTDVRLVMKNDKITVFFMTRQSTSSAAAWRTSVGVGQDNGPRRLLVGLGLAAALTVPAVGFALRRRRPPAPPQRRPAQGCLLATLAQSRGLVYDGRLAPRQSARLSPRAPHYPASRDG